MTNPEVIYCWRNFTDRGRGERLVLSEHRSSVKVAKNIKTHRIHAGSVWRMKDNLFSMCQNIFHLTCKGLLIWGTNVYK
jgi:hypothetical protein